MKIYIFRFMKKNFQKKNGIFKFNYWTISMDC